jgi:hypothetical protein
MNVTAEIKIANGSRIILLNDFFNTELDHQLFSLFKQFTVGNIEWQEQTEYAHQAGRYVYCGNSIAVDQLMGYAAQLSTIDYITDLLGTSVQFLSCSLWADVAGYSITPHYDLAPFEYAVQVYMTDPVRNFEMMGTAFYEDKTDKLLLEIPYKRNSGYLLDSCHTVWHGLHHAIPPGYYRYSVYLRYKKA